MGRLIDADALIEEIANMDISEQSKIFSVNMLRTAPTAYDVEKVIAEMKSAENYYNDDTLDEEGNLKMFKAIRQDVAIELVRKGGVE